MHEHIYARAESTFAQAIFFKPREAAAVDVDVYMAPLIVQEVEADDPPPSSDFFGAVAFEGDTPRVDPSPPVVYAGRRTVMLHGRAHEELIYLWFYAGDTAGLPAQGLGMVLDANGLPMIWEVWANDEPARVLFVSRAFEQAAAQRYGGPLQGRRYSSEPDPGAQPQAVVARVLDDGPVPLGPLIYLAAESRAVVAVLCRCMPSQVDDFTDTVYYELRPLDELLERGFVVEDWMDEHSAVEIQIAFSPGAAEVESHLERLLRGPLAQPAGVGNP